MNDHMDRVNSILSTSAVMALNQIFGYPIPNSWKWKHLQPGCQDV